MKKKIEFNPETGENTPAGSIAKEISEKVVSEKDPLLVGDVSCEHVKELSDLLNRQVEYTTKKWPDQSFFIEVNLKKDFISDIIANIAPLIRKIPKARRTCPEPFYDQIVFYYDHKKEVLELLWSIPDIDTCFTYLMRTPKNLNKAEQDLYYYIKDFDSGLLDHKVKEYDKKQRKQYD